jgi:hypothetical protein
MKLTIENYNRLTGLWENEGIIISDVSEWGDRYIFQCRRSFSDISGAENLHLMRNPNEEGLYALIKSDKPREEHILSIEYLKHMKNMAIALGVELGTIKPVMNT